MKSPKGLNSTERIAVQMTAVISFQSDEMFAEHNLVTIAKLREKPTVFRFCKGREENKIN